MEQKLTIAIAGTGYVGLSNAVLLAQHNRVWAVDVLPEKVELINQRKSPIRDKEIEEYLAAKELDLTATTDGEKAYAEADFVIISTPTNYDPKKNYFDTSSVEAVIEMVLQVNPKAVIFVDNCYGEFTQTQEPLAVGADLIAGSFIKNPGGGITPTGGYIAGRADLVEKCSHRFTAPGIGADLGCTQDSLRDTFLGFYYAPGVVCEALKTAIYAQCLLELAGVHPVPRYTEDHNDIVTCFDSGSAAALTGFCAGIQHNSPIDSFASPEPADEPGYTDKVVMASGSFTEGSTIEISCDGPLRAPYTCYLQGGVNFPAGRAAVLNAVQNAFFA